MRHAWTPRSLAPRPPCAVKRTDLKDRLEVPPDVGTADPGGVRQPLPGDTGWHRYEWTVPAVDTVHTLGVEVYSATDQPLILWLGAVSW